VPRNAPMTGWARALPFHYAWLIVICGVIANTVSGGAMFWAVTVYVPHIAEEFDTGRTTVVAAFMVGQTVFALVGPITGRYIDRHGARGAMIAGAVLCSAALAATSQSREVWHLFAGWGALSVVRSLVMPIPYNWTITRWFEGRRRQAALGIVTVGFGLGGAVMMPLVKVIADRVDWSAAMLVTAVLLLLAQGLPALFIVRDRPADLGLRPLVAEDERREEGVEVVEWGFSPGQAVRMPAFWLLGIGLMLFFLGQGSVATLSIDFFESRGVQAGATAIAVSAFLRAIGRLPLGFLVGRIRDVYWLGVAVAATQAVALAVLVASTSGMALVTWVVLWGMGGAFAPMLEPLMINRTFGIRHFGAVAGLVQMVAFGGQIFGAIGGALLFDLLESYDVPFLLYTAGFGVAAGLFVLLSLAMRGTKYREQAARAGYVAQSRPS
jgi:MFS family permease